MFVITKKTKCNGRKPTSEFLYHVTMSDGKHIATFISDGSNKICLENLSGCENNIGSRFYASKCQPGILNYLPGFGTEENINTQIDELLLFLNECLDVPIYFHVNEWLYTY